MTELTSSHMNSTVNATSSIFALINSKHHFEKGKFRSSLRPVSYLKKQAGFNLHEVLFGVFWRLLSIWIG